MQIHTQHSFRGIGVSVSLAALGAFLWCFAPAAWASPWLMPAAIHACATGAAEFSIEDVTTLQALAPSRIPLWPVWSQDEQRIAYTATDPAYMNGYAWLSEIWTLDLATKAGGTRMLSESNGATCHSLCFVVDDSSLLYLDNSGFAYGGIPSLCDAHTAGRETSLGIRPVDLVPSAAAGMLLHSDIKETPNGIKMVLDFQHSVSLGGASVFLMPASASGVPDIAHKTTIVDNVSSVTPTRVSLSPSGNELLLAHWHQTSNPDIALITGLDRIVQGQDPPIRSWSDARVKIINDGPNHADAPSWSEDGSLFFYGYDFSGRFSMTSMNFQDADFDVMIVRLSDALSGNLTPTRIQLPGNQGCIAASRGGTRILFGMSGSPNNKICAGTLCISDQVYINGGGVVQSPFTLKDGSATALAIAQSTVVSHYGSGSGPLRVTLSTPVLPIGASAMPPGAIGLRASRVCCYENTVPGANLNPQPIALDPPASLKFTYTNAEVAGLEEGDLLVYQFNPDTGTFDLPLATIARDPASKSITVALNTIPPKPIGKALTSNMFALGVIDSDGDGLPDGRELQWDGNPGANIYDPLSNPTGTDLNPGKADTDDDGVPDATEVTFGSNPLDSERTPGALPVADTRTLAILMACFIAAAHFGHRRSRGSRQE